MVQSSTAFIGMDVHKESIDIAIADAKEARHYGRIAGDGAALGKAIRKLRTVHRRPVFVYEAGPCGFRIYRRLRAQGLECMVVSPSKTPRNAADRVKTDRRDAVTNALLGRRLNVLPPGKYQHCRMALERAREHLCTLYTKAYAIVLNGRKRRLRNARTLGQLILTQTLQLANDAHRLAD